MIPNLLLGFLMKSHDNVPAKSEASTCDEDLFG